MHMPPYWALSKNQMTHRVTITPRIASSIFPDSRMGFSLLWKRRHMHGEELDRQVEQLQHRLPDQRIERNRQQSYIEPAAQALALSQRGIAEHQTPSFLVVVLDDLHERAFTN